jgi:hypothetical protein
MTFSEINRLHVALIGSVLGSLTTYIICLFFFSDYLHIASLTFEQILFILILFAISWVPFFLWKYYLCYSGASEKGYGRQMWKKLERTQTSLGLGKTSMTGNRSKGTLISNEADGLLCRTFID